MVFWPVERSWSAMFSYLSLKTCKVTKDERRFMTLIHTGTSSTADAYVKSCVFKPSPSQALEQKKCPALLVGDSTFT